MTERIAVIDTLFHRPPTGGAWADEYEKFKVIAREKKVKFFIVDMPDYFPRGVVKEELPFDCEKIKFKPAEYTPEKVCGAFYEAVKKFNPDKIFIGGGGFMKVHLVNFLARYYPVILRFYSYEILCLNGNFFSNLTKSVCSNSILIDKNMCLKCSKISKKWRFILKKIFFRNIHFEHDYFMARAYEENFCAEVKKALFSAEKIIVYSDFLKEKIKPFNKNVYIVPACVDLSFFKPLKDRGTQSARQTDEFILFFPNRSRDYVKGFGVLIKADEILKKEGVDIKVLFTEEAPAKKAYPENFINLGWLKREEILKYYRECDAVIVPSLWEEPFGITALEALACGKPVIASNTGELKTIIKNSENGFLFETGNAYDLACKIKALINNETYKKLFNSARASAENYGAAETARMLNGLL